MEFLTFRLGNEDYGIDILAVQEIRAYGKPTHIPTSADFIRGVINLRGAIVPIIDLRIKFGMADALHDASTVTIILNIGNRTLGIVVDSVCDVLRFKPEEILPAPEFHVNSRNRFIRNLASHDERLVILLEVEELMTSADMASVDSSMAQPQAALAA
ncbi:MAG: chemotaxis protein CheW [Usitatibacter sp.]